ncbi:NEDD4-binding protein 2 [Clupea harengus]|uniref:NEDD4-binding protein 2 n=1 Tax=Clupea harengus TaxID=7950 RepID=A0A8M1K9I4_CLUHA|nr:NEDD4-binding protein 2 [Clupea harengus]
MPKKRKNGESPARAPGQQNDSWSNIDNRVYGASEPCLHGEPNRSNSAYGMPNSSAVGFTDREHIMRNMEEVFSHLDPEVIHMVLTECDFNMENAMDSLLELSDAAKGVPSLPPPVSGFEFAAALLNPDIPQSVSSYPKTTGSRTKAVHTPHTLTHSTQSEPSPLAASVPLSSLPSPQPPAWQALLGNPSVESGQHQTSSPKQRQDSRGNSPVGELSFAGGCASVDRSDRLDFSHLIGGSVGLGGSGSAFQAYRRDEQPRAVGAAWNLTAPEFHPRSEGPSFITPVALNPNLAARLSTYGSVSQAPLKPTATIPTSWAVQQPPIHGNKPTTAPTFNQRLRFEGRVLVLLRGAPGSGKSTLARAMLDHNPGGVSLSTDGYFCRQGEYCYDPSELSTAHEWNQQRAKEAMERAQGPVIIDNTNMQSWEMRPYVAMALKQKYKVVFREPDTWWKFKPRELEKRTKHGVTREKIRRMLDGYDRHVSVNSIMGSSRRPDLHTELPVTSDLPRPDLLGPPPPVCLPDVSSMPVGSVFVGQPPELLDCVDLYQDPQEVEKQLPVEPPVLFSQSIAQRERRARDRARHPGGPQPAEQPSTAPTQDRVRESSGPGNNREIFATGSAAVHGETAKGNGAQRARLAFVGDWPCESQDPQDQRTINRRRAEKEARGQGDGVGTEVKRSGGGPDFTEFHKLLDLLQGDTEVGGQIQLSDSEEESSPSSSSGPDTQPQSPSCLTEDSTHVPISNREKDIDGDKEGEEDSGEESNKEEEEIKKDGEREGKGKKESKAGKESEGKGEEGGEDREGSDSFHVSEKRRLSRRAGKPCRLALTFTKQAPPSVSPHHPQPESPLQPERQTQDVSTETVSSCGISTQTESSDLALLWRMEHGGLWEGVGEKVLTGNATHFVPAVSEAPSACPVRRATHEKGAQVEEEELMEARTEDADLSILIRHFKGVAVETLKDLYDKCQQDVEWTTNLLLDSGEEMSREDKEGDETEDEDEFELQDECEGGEAEEEEATKREEMKDREGEEAEAVGIGIAESTGEDTGPDVSSCDLAGKALEGTHDDAEDHSQLRQESESQREPSAQEPTSQATMTSQSQEASQQERTSESQSQSSGIEHTGTGTRLLTDACAEQSEWAVGLQRDKDGQVERDGEEDVRGRLEEVDAVTQSILTQLEELVKKEEDEKERERRERERERRKEKTKASNPLDIQSLELRLPTELALQLTELFGPVGANPVLSLFLRQVLR